MIVIIVHLVLLNHSNINLQKLASSLQVILRATPWKSPKPHPSTEASGRWRIDTGKCLGFSGIPENQELIDLCSLIIMAILFETWWQFGSMWYHIISSRLQWLFGGIAHFQTHPMSAMPPCPTKKWRIHASKHWNRSLGISDGQWLRVQSCSDFWSTKTDGGTTSDVLHQWSPTNQCKRPGSVSQGLHTCKLIISCSTSCRAVEALALIGKMGCSMALASKICGLNWQKFMLKGNMSTDNQNGDKNKPKLVVWQGQNNISMI